MSRRKVLYKELKRKSLHLFQILGLLLYTYLLNVYSQRIALLVAVGILIVFLKLEYLRLEYEVKVPRFLRFLMRKKENRNYTGIIYFTLGAIISFAIFDYTIAVTAILFAAVGDFASAIFGIAFGEKKLLKNKTYVGFTAGLIANYLVGTLFLINHPVILISMVMTASFVELITHKLDDNLTVPVYSGFVGQIIAMYFGVVF